MEQQIRLINLSDAQATLDIYTPNVINSSISFEYEPPTLEDWKNRIKTNMQYYPWLVCETETGEIAGYAYGSRHRYRDAYNWSPESTVYISEKYHRKSLARVLYETLFALLKLQGYYNVYAGVCIPNEKSEKFHEALGFNEVGIFKNIGYKLGAWRSTRWFQFHLDKLPFRPELPKKLKEVIETAEFNNILKEANRQIQKTAL